MASNKHAQIRYKVLDDCFSNYRRKFYFDDLMDRCNDALRELYGEEHTGIKTRTLRSDINYIRTRAAEAGVEVEVKDDGNGYYYRYSEPDFSIFKRGLGEDDLAQLKETILMLQRFKGMPNFDWMSSQHLSVSSNSRWSEAYSAPLPKGLQTDFASTHQHHSYLRASTRKQSPEARLHPRLQGKFRRIETVPGQVSTEYTGDLCPVCTLLLPHTEAAIRATSSICSGLN